MNGKLIGASSHLPIGRSVANVTRSSARLLADDEDDEDDVEDVESKVEEDEEEEGGPEDELSDEDDNKIALFSIPIS